MAVEFWARAGNHLLVMVLRQLGLAFRMTEELFALVVQEELADQSLICDSRPITGEFFEMFEDELWTSRGLQATP